MDTKCKLRDKICSYIFDYLHESVSSELDIETRAGSSFYAYSVVYMGIYGNTYNAMLDDVRLNIRQFVWNYEF